MDEITEVQKDMLYQEKCKIIEALKAEQIEKKNAVNNGDLSENAELDASQGKISTLNSRLEFIDNILKNSRVRVGIPKSNKIDICSIVGLQKLDNNNNPIEDVVYYQISSVGNYRFKILSKDSIIGRAIYLNKEGIYTIVDRLGRKVKYKVTIVPPDTDDVISLLNVSIDKVSAYDYVNNKLSEWNKGNKDEAS